MKDKTIGFYREPISGKLVRLDLSDVQGWIWAVELAPSPTGVRIVNESLNSISDFAGFEPVSLTL